MKAGLLRGWRSVTTGQLSKETRFLLLTWGDDVEVHALRRRGWSISAIARHTGRDRKTVRGYLNGERTPGVRKRAVDPFAPFLGYVTARLIEDPHLWAITLFDELVGLGFVLSYQSLTREIRARKLRPACLACAGATGRVNSVIEHPPGAETQWDWLDLPDPPASCRWRSARRGPGTAKAWWRRPTTPPRNAGGAPWATTSPSSRRKRASRGSPPLVVTPGCGPGQAASPASRRWPRPSRCARHRPPPIR